MGLGGGGPPGAQSSAAPTGVGGLARGRKLYSQICVSCHGPEGNLVAGHELSTLKKRRDLAGTIAYIKNPKPPMPGLYPSLIGEQNVTDVATYVLQELAHQEPADETPCHGFGLCAITLRV
jgi:mono/diheme cytochrome c family protein